MKVISVLIVILLCGCVPYPHYETATSHVFGKVASDEEVSRVSYYPGKLECSQIENYSRVDESGKFELPHTERLVFFQLAFVATCSSYLTICVETKSKLQYMWRGEDIHGCESLPEKIEVSCGLHNSEFECSI